MIILTLLAIGLLYASQGWAIERAVPGNYSTIQAAIDAADPQGGDTVLVAPGTYEENITLRNNVTLQGKETARTLLKSDNSTPVISINGLTAATVSNLTFIDADVGIRVLNSTGIVISNNVFNLDVEDRGNLALDVPDTSEVKVEHNTFYNNLIALNRFSDAVEVKNNIFAENTTVITPDTISGNGANNCVYNNDTLGPVGIPRITGNPLFAAVSLRDFHLREGSPCIDAASGGTDVIDDTAADIGAYGGDMAEGGPFPVQGLSSPIDVSADELVGPFAVELNWSANLSYLVSHTTKPGGYYLYYKQNISGAPYNGTDADGGTSPSPITVTADPSVAPMRTLADLAPETTAKPTSPTLLSISPSNQTLDISWSAVSDNDLLDYQLTIDDGITPPEPIPVGTNTFWHQTGLNNGTSYNISVVARAQTKYFFVVTAFDSTADKNQSTLSTEVSLRLGPERESDPSNVMVGLPERVIAVPDLPDEGCFIATAAFGYYSAPQVQVLRDLRDRYLLTNKAGQQFVQWYYTHGPTGAHYINQHPELKPLVRVALYPLIIGSTFIMQASPLAKGLLVVLLMIGLCMYMTRRQLNRLARHSVTG
jgi:hypothetical protein